ncbi:hypothetical protein K492DRAFT_171323 [Lichtheimia hyalospora FSU 10163]|nr:hypothetical protein K492DRAFT_171323 [Lichtheimia hyalospora FSU 10163]
MHRIIAATLLLDRLQALLMKAYVEQTKTLRLKHFATLMFVYMGACSRLYCMAHRWSAELQQCYDLIQEWHAAFPSGIKPKDKAKEATTHIDYSCLPDTCMQARRDAIQEWSGQPEIPGILTFKSMKTVQNPTPVPSVPRTESTMNTTPLMEDDDLGEIIERPI